jgi:hypothetical protein
MMGLSSLADLSVGVWGFDNRMFYPSWRLKAFLDVKNYSRSALTSGTLGTGNALASVVGGRCSNLRQATIAEQFDAGNEAAVLARKSVIGFARSSQILVGKAVQARRGDRAGIDHIDADLASLSSAAQVRAMKRTPAFVAS